ncbi:secretion pathway protein Sls2/Rcy1, putative [Cordyceps militaris CM01]|uniref:Secretion pathway protein Sls2/Rcy1, putative n=1 Tax=Cordyceps militaris (strain CM01) TaxID=983644 RepID=G3JST1_CORMM|nr:secretion pathway protein Sls2/Rcy1, putative [Cordyceps militaris CM01]EGX88927.1 secretion pathway protein Sls2/Rcy1, putative [Cordyceps militaris CM01]
MLANVFSKAAILALATAASASPVSVEGSDFKKQTLDAHNWYRHQHSAAPLVWDDKLASNAESWASQCSSDPRHQPDNDHGENIAWGTVGGPDYLWVNLWGKERMDYNFSSPGFTSGTGHFTQLVWKGTKRVGCALVSCDYGTNVVCEYDPPGNMVGNNNQYFKDNVGRQIEGKPSDQYKA